MRRKHTNLTLSPEVLQRAMAYAQAQNKSLSRLIEDLLIGVTQIKIETNNGNVTVNHAPANCAAKAKKKSGKK